MEAEEWPNLQKKIINDSLMYIKSQKTWSSPFQAFAPVLSELEMSSMEPAFEKMIEKVIFKKFKEVSLPIFRSVEDRIAKKEIIGFVELRKKMGKPIFNIIELMNELKLPADQIDRIMEQLAEEGKVREE